MHAHEEVACKRLHIRLRGGISVAALDRRAGDAIDMGTVAAPLDVGAGASVSGQMEDDDVGPDRADGLVVKAELLEGPASEIFRDQVADHDEALDHREPLRAAAVDGEGALVADDVDEGGAVVPGPGPRIAARVPTHPGREGRSHGGGEDGGGSARGRVPDVWVLDPDAVGAEIREVHRRRLARPDRGEITDADAFQGEIRAHATAPDRVRSSIAAPS